MKITPIILGILLSLLLIFGIHWLSQPQKVGGRSIPAFGPLMNPYTGFWQNATPTKNQWDKSINIPGITGEVEVYYDERMVPHIFAENTADALYAQGYITASNRLFQMDISTRATAGRLSEILGKNVLPQDIEQRRRGLVFAAENAVKEWRKNPEGSRLLNAYSAGVNAYIHSLNTDSYPLEYKLIGAKPEEWSDLKTALFVKAMAADLAERHHDIEATNAMLKFGKDTFNYLYPEYFKEETPIIPPQQKWNFEVQDPMNPTTDEEHNIIAPFQYTDYYKDPPGIGSNNWAVAGDKTKSGVPILCGDPHLRLTLPSIWYEIQIHTPEFNTYGVSLPGIPFIIIGFNENVAWSQTNVGHDVVDLYQIKWKDNTKMEYLLDGEYQKVELKVEEYQVKGQGTVRDTVRYTVWGPVRYESANSLDKDLAYRWLAHDGSDQNEIISFLALNKAKDFESFYEALNSYNVPAQNFAFATKQGDIGIRISGKFPIKENQQGRFVRDGSKQAAGWNGYIPKDQNPIVKNPPQGFVASANQHSTSPDYPYYYNREYFESFRGRIINRFLAEGQDLTVQDMMDFQNSNYDLKAEEALPLMLQYLPKKTQEEHPNILSLLKNWDYTYRADAKAATFFYLWFSKLYGQLWDEMRSKDLPILPPTEIRTIQLMRDAPNSSFFDDKSTTEKESITDIVLQSFLATKEELGTAIPKWHDYQNPKVAHLTKADAFSSSVYTGGVASALNAQTPTNGPSWRQIVVMGDVVKAYVSYPGGQSGNPGSPHYQDFLDTWADGRYFEAAFMQSKDDYANKIIGKQIFVGE